MKQKLISVLFFSGTLLYGFLSSAQGSFANEILKIQKAYKKSTPLSFSVKYLYSTVEHPSVIKDSAEGRYRLMGSRSWGVLNDAEYITDENYSVIVYAQSNMIMLDKPEENLSQLFSIDSLLKMSDQFTVNAPVRGHFQLHLKDNELIKSVEFFYDKDNYLLQKITYVLHAQESEERKEKEEGFVQILFSSYSTAPLDESVFDTKKYFVKKGKEFVPTSSYEGYTIFLASSKLLN